MRVWIAALLLACVPSGAMAIPTGEFIARWKAISYIPSGGVPAGTDMEAIAKATMAKPEFKLLVSEFSNAVDRYRESVQASRKAGKPRACPPSGLESTIDGLIVDIQRLPAGWEKRELSDTLAEAMDRRYPCVAASNGDVAVSGTIHIELLPGAQRRPVPIDRLRTLASFEGRVNGQAATVVVDDGFDRTTLDIAFARRLGLKVGPPTYELKTGHSVVKASMTEEATFEVPHTGTFRASWLVLDLTSMSKMAGRPIDAILGNDAIGPLALTMWTGTRSWMKLQGSGTVRPLDRPSTLTVPIVNGGEVEATINGQPVRLRIDLGYTGFISLYDAAWRRAFPAGTPNMVTGTTTAVDGIAREVRTARGSLKMGGMTSTDVPIDGSGGTGSYDGLLGAAFLLQGSMLLDQPAKLLSVTLKPDAPAKPAPDPARPQ